MLNEQPQKLKWFEETLIALYESPSVGMMGPIHLLELAARDTVPAPLYRRSWKTMEKAEAFVTHSWSNFRLVSKAVLEQEAEDRKRFLMNKQAEQLLRFIRSDCRRRSSPLWVGTSAELERLVPGLPPHPFGQKEVVGVLEDAGKCLFDFPQGIWNIALIPSIKLWPQELATEITWWNKNLPEDDYAEARFQERVAFWAEQGWRVFYDESLFGDDEPGIDAIFHEDMVAPL